jgi:hypothetical protein
MSRVLNCTTLKREWGETQYQGDLRPSGFAIVTAPVVLLPVEEVFATVLCAIALFFFFADTFTWLPVLHPAWRRNCTHLSWPASTQFVHAYCFWKEKANLRENWLDSLDSLEGGLAVAAFPRRPLETARGNGSEDKIRKSSENEREQAQPATQSCFWQQFVVLFLVIRNS